MYSAGQFSKNSSTRDKERQQSNSAANARKAAQQNRAKHRAEFEMKVGTSVHPPPRSSPRPRPKVADHQSSSPRPKPKVADHQSSSSHQSTSSVSSNQQQKEEKEKTPTPRRRKRSTSRGTAYICMGLLGGFLIIIGVLLMAFGFTSKEFSWTTASLGTIISYAGISTFSIGILLIFICLCICCLDRRRKRKREEEYYFHESGRLEKCNNNQSNQLLQVKSKEQGGQLERANRDNLCHQDQMKRYRDAKNDN